MNTIIAWVAGSKAAAIFNKVRDFLAGNKTYIVAAGAFVHAGVNVLSAIASMHGLPDFISYVRAANSNPDLIELWSSLALMTTRAAIAKAEVPDLGPSAH